MFNCEVNGVRGYATNDFFIEHPDDPELVKVFGRVDDQITLSTGEKVRDSRATRTLMYTESTARADKPRPHGSVYFLERSALPFDLTHF